MGKVNIITNGHRRDLLYWHELTEAEQAEFDWIKDEDDGHQFFRYKGWVYCLSDFMRTDFHNSPFKEWNGYSSDTFFSGVLIRWGDVDYDRIVVGWYYS